MNNERDFHEDHSASSWDWRYVEEDLRARKCDDGGCRRPRTLQLVTNCPRQMSGPSTKERGCHGIGVDGFAARQLRMRMIDMLGIYYFTHTENRKKGESHTSKHFLSFFYSNWVSFYRFFFFHVF